MFPRQKLDTIMGSGVFYEVLADIKQDKFSDSFSVSRERL
jgi:hypothetical protein